jgi:hypothetical protein
MAPAGRRLRGGFRRRGARILLGLATLLGAGLPVRAAHEWRAAWAAPYPLEVLERATSLTADSTRAASAYALPYEVPGLSFHSVRARTRGGQWEVHAGVLRGPHYREWHAGVGRRLAAGSTARVLLGVRVFGLTAGSAQPPARAAFTLMATAAPTWLPILRLQSGLVDLAPGGGAEVPAVVVTRASLTGGRAMLLVECSACQGGESEMLAMTALRLGPIELRQAWRWEVGEASVAVALRSGAARVTIGQRWHPVLGWTPNIAIAWLHRPHSGVKGRDGEERLPVVGDVGSASDVRVADRSSSSGRGQRR